ncbi:MAG: SurA N-terminal domain-containing protein [Pseudomonadales bacterium]|nr:SurA N-terminal domain-containing protein [Pseudomonadales bacterium]
MLQKMRAQTQSLAFKVLVGIIIFVLAVFGFGAFNLFGSGDPDIARVNGDSITQGMVTAEAERERRRLAAQLGADFDPGMIDPVRLQNLVVEQMIARTLMKQAADDLGLTAGDAEVARVIRRDPNFQVDGVFQESRYRLVAQGMGYTPQGFIEETREILTLGQLQNGVVGTALATERDVQNHARLLGQRRDLAYLPFTLERFAAEVEVSDDDVALRYEENRLDYMTEESVDVDYVELVAAELANDPSIAVSEDAVREAYEADRAAAPAGEERRSRHILLTLTDARDAAAASAEIEALKARIAAGEAFEDLARAVSEDPGSAAQGGDLGLVGRGVFDKAFEDALFALAAPGDLSGPVATEFGYHLIRLDEIRASEYPAFEDARAAIEQRLRREQADALYQERLRELDNLAFERPNDLAGIAADLGLEIRRTDGVTRSTGDGVFAAQPVRDALFAREVLDNGFNSAAVEHAAGRAVVMRVAERHPAEQIPLEALAEALRDQITSERARDLARQAREAAEARVAAGDPVAEIALAHGVNWQRFEGAMRSAEDIPRDVLDVAFRLTRPAPGDKSVGAAELSGGGSAVVTVTRVQDGDVAAMTESEIDGIRRFVADRTARLDFGGFYESLERAASIRRPN